MNENTEHFAAALRELEPAGPARERGMSAAMAAFDAAFNAAPETENAKVAQGSDVLARPMVETRGHSGVRDLGSRAMSTIRDLFTNPRNAMMGGSCAAALIAALFVVQTDPGVFDLNRPLSEIQATDMDVEDTPIVTSPAPAPADVPEAVPTPAPAPEAVVTEPVTAELGSTEAGDDKGDVPSKAEPVPEAPIALPADTSVDADASSPAPLSPPVMSPPVIERSAEAIAPMGESADSIVVTGSRAASTDSGSYASGSHGSTGLDSGLSRKESAAPMATTTASISAPDFAPVPVEGEVRRVLKTPARTVERVVPAVTKMETRRIRNADGTFDTVTEPVVVQEATVEIITLPAVYEDVIILPKPEPDPQPEPQSGQLTAGDYDDVLNPDLYKLYTDRMLQGALRGKDLPHIDAERRIAVSVEDRRGRPVPLADITVRDRDGDRAFSLKTGADGRAWLYPGHDDLESGARIEARVDGRKVSRTISNSMVARGGQLTLELDTRAAAVERMDLLLTIDATGSMSDEMRYLQTELRAILTRVEAAHPGIDIRTGLVVYRDVGDAYVVREVPFTDDIVDFQTKLMAQSAGGGGDTPEAMHTALSTGLAMDWREDALKVNLLVADAPPHDRHIAETWESAQASRERGIHMVPLAASGVDKTAEFVMRGMAQITAGRFLFLTDDSGIGNPHAEPTVDCYVVTRLDGLVTRVLSSLVGGERVEPRPGEVIRSVGDYDAGVCDVGGNIVRVSQQER